MADFLNQIINTLIQWGQVNIGLGDGFLPVWHKAITWTKMNYRQISNIKHTLLENKIIDHSDVVGASPVGAAATASSSWT